MRSCSFAESSGKAIPKLRFPTRRSLPHSQYTAKASVFPSSRATGRGKRPRTLATATTSQYSILSRIVESKHQSMAFLPLLWRTAENRTQLFKTQNEQRGQLGDRRTTPFARF
jgi:hypothetical protein